MIYYLTIAIVCLIILSQIVFYFAMKEKFHNVSDYEIYLINLDRSPDRLKNINEHLQNLNLRYRRISGVDGKQYNSTVEIMNGEGYKNDLPCGDRDLSYMKGTAGCFLSHIKTWKEFLKSDKTHALIMEDDGRFIIRNPSKKLHHIINNADFIWLNAQKKLNNGEEYSEPPKHGTHGYIINKKTVKKLLTDMTPDSKWYMNNTINGENCYIDNALLLYLKQHKNIKTKNYSIIEQKQGLDSLISDKTNTYRMY